MRFEHHDDVVFLQLKSLDNKMDDWDQFIETDWPSAKQEMRKSFVQLNVIIEERAEVIAKDIPTVVVTKVLPRVGKSMLLFHQPMKTTVICRSYSEGCIPSC